MLLKLSCILKYKKISAKVYNINEITCDNMKLNFA